MSNSYTGSIYPFFILYCLLRQRREPVDEEMHRNRQQQGTDHPKSIEKPGISQVENLAIPKPITSLSSRIY